MYVAIDKFTKWPEVEPVRKVTTQSAVKFFKGLVCRFGVPNRVITDNDTQFTSHTFMQYIQTSAARSILPLWHTHGATAKLRGKMLKYYDAWGQRLLTGCTRAEGAGLMSCRRFFGRSERRQIEPPARHPALVYGAEAVLPTELIYGSPRVLAYDEIEQERLRQDDAMLLEEDRVRAAVRAVRYQQALRRYHSHKVHA